MSFQKGDYTFQVDQWRSGDYSSFYVAITKGDIPAERYTFYDLLDIRDPEFLKLHDGIAETPERLFCFYRDGECIVYKKFVGLEFEKYIKYPMELMSVFHDIHSYIRKWYVDYYAEDRRKRVKLNEM